MKQPDYVAALAVKRRIETDGEYAALAGLVVRVAVGGRKAIEDFDKDLVASLRVAYDLIGAEKAVNALADR